MVDLDIGAHHASYVGDVATFACRISDVPPNRLRILRSGPAGSNTSSMSALPVTQ
jgi:glycerate-2-kinase